MLDLIVFDLDGTLVDSRRDIATSVNELRLGLGRPALPEERIYGYIGNGVRALLARSLEDCLPSNLDRAVAAYLPIYRRHLLDTTTAYPGVREALAELAPEAPLGVLTNKPSPESVLLLEGLGLDRYFRFVFGGEDFPTRKPHPLGLERLLVRAGARRERTLFVGDSVVDFETARNTGVSFGLVWYEASSLSRTDLEALAPDLLFTDWRDLVRFVRSSG